MTVIRVSDFSITPGGRYRKDGLFSGEEFREDILILALNRGNVIVDLDNVEGMSPGFLDEVFGGIVRKFGVDVISKIEIVSKQVPSRVERVRKYMLNEKNCGLF